MTVSIERAAFRARLRYYYLWSVTVSGASMLHFLLLRFPGIRAPYAAWALLLVSIGVSAYWGRQQKAQGQGRAKAFVQHIWTGFVLAHLLALGIGIWQEAPVAPVIFLLAGYATFLTGQLLVFRPLKRGALLMAAAAAASPFVPGGYHLLLTPVAVLTGFTWPLGLLERHGG